MYDVTDPNERKVLEWLGGAAYWCNECSNISGPRQPCQCGYNPRATESEKEAYEAYGTGSGTPIEREIVQALHDKNVEDAKRVLINVKKRKQDPYIPGISSYIWNLLEHSEVDRKSYNAVIDNIIRTLPPTE